MKRRAFTIVAGCASILRPLAARAQPVPVIGYLGLTTAGQYGSRLNAFREGLGAMGYQEGRNVRIAYRWAEGHSDRLQGLAADLVRERVSVIVTPGSVLSALSAKAATATIPIVFEIGADPVAFGLVSSMSRPGGNITGVTSLNVELNSKRLELLHEVVPRLSAVAVLVNPANPQAGPAEAHMETAARGRGLRLHQVRATTETEIDTVFETLPRLGVEGLVIAADQFFVGSARQLASLALHQALPAIHFTREFPDAGGLMSYGGTFAETHRLTGVYAGRILKGEKPAGLPVQQAAQFEMAVNLATARTLRLTFPPSLLARADEVIE